MGVTEGLGYGLGAINLASGGPQNPANPLLHYSITPLLLYSSEPLLWLAVHFPEWMFVQQIWFDTAKLLTVVDLNSDVIIQRTDRRSLIEKNIFGLVKDL